MTTCTETLQTSEANASWVQKIGGVAKSAWHAFWERRANRAAVVMLQSMDAQALHDIGVNRSEIESMVYGARRDRRNRD
jgi:uncharacterized protein YjiS (DUF1127 family)